MTTETLLKIVAWWTISLSAITLAWIALCYFHEWRRKNGKNERKETEK